jgi:hypothetical protein
MVAVLAAVSSPKGLAALNDLRLAIHQVHGRLKGALGFSSAQISNYVSGEQPSLIARLADDEAIERAYVERRAKAHGLRILDADVVAALEEITAQRKRMARMGAEERTER